MTAAEPIAIPAIWPPPKPDDDDDELGLAVLDDVGVAVADEVLEATVSEGNGCPGLS